MRHKFGQHNEKKQIKLSRLDKDELIFRELMTSMDEDEATKLKQDLGLIPRKLTIKAIFFYFIYILLFLFFSYILSITIFNMKKDKSYFQRNLKQLTEWVKGNPIHNDVDNECCPDFSCCKPEFLRSKSERKKYLTASDEERDAMASKFLEEAIKKEYPKKVIEVIFEGLKN